MLIKKFKPYESFTTLSGDVIQNRGSTVVELAIHSIKSPETKPLNIGKSNVATKQSKKI